MLGSSHQRGTFLECAVSQFDGSLDATGMSSEDVEVGDDVASKVPDKPRPVPRGTEGVARQTWDIWDTNCAVGGSPNPGARFSDSSDGGFLVHQQICRIHPVQFCCRLWTEPCLIEWRVAKLPAA